MGKKSREKKESRESEIPKPPRGQEKSENKVISICLNVIKWGIGLSLFTPLIIIGRFTETGFSSPFYFPFVGPKSFYFMALAQIIFFAWLILMLYSPQYRPKLNLLTIFLILFFLFAVISSVWGENLSYSFWSKHERMTGLLMWLHLLAFFLVASSTLRKKDWTIVFAVSVFVGVILSFIAFSPQNSGGLTQFMGKGATIGNSSFLGTYLIFNLFFALYLVFTSKKGLKVYSGVCFLIIFLGLISIQARAATVSFLGGLVLLLFLWLIFCQQGNLRRLGFSLLIIYIILAVSFAFFVFQPESFARKGVVSKIADPLYAETLGGRFIVWKTAWQGFLQKPFLGWGLESFEYVFAKNYNPCLGTPECGDNIWYDRAHNIILDTLVERGLLGLLLYIGIFLAVFYILWLNYFRGLVSFWIPGVFGTLLVSYFVQNLTVFDMISSYLAFFLVLGFAASITSFNQKEQNFVTESSSGSITSNVRLKWIVVLVSILLLVASSFYFVIQPLKSSSYVISAANSPHGSPERLNYYQRALRASPLGKYQIREFFGQRSLEFYLTERVTEAQPENIKREIDFLIEGLEKTKAEISLELRSRFVLGQLYNVYARLFDPIKTAQAEIVLQEAIDISPTNQQGYWNLAQTRLYQQRFDEALVLAQEALDLEPELFQSHWVLVRIANLMGDAALVKEKIERALEINPNWEQDLVQSLGP